MKRLIIFLGIFLSMVMITSCKKSFLDIEDNSEAIRQIYISDLKTTGEYLNGIYITLSTPFFNGDYYIYPEIIADNIKPVSPPRALLPHYKWAQIAEELSYSEQNMNLIWGSGYNIARSCSFVIEKATAYQSENAEMANEYLAQAYALRAFVHFTLLNIFAQSYNFSNDASHPGIPYVKNSDWTENTIRSNVSEVYVNLIEDLTSAISKFTVTSGNRYKMNINTAKAILARVYLFMGDYQKAKNLAREVSNTVPIMKGSDYPSKLFTTIETESLMQLPPLASDYFTFYAGGFLTGSSTYYLATNDIATILQESPTDVRRSWVVSNGSNWNIRKFPTGVVPGITARRSYYQTIIRSSEMYLTLAETYAKLGNEDSARFFLDEIRLRADAAASTSTATGAPLLDSIYKERRKELAFEGMRMFDLLRWKKGVDRFDAQDPAAQNLPYPSNKAIAPIPVLDVKVSGIPQNAGY